MQHVIGHNGKKKEGKSTEWSRRMKFNGIARVFLMTFLCGTREARIFDITPKLLRNSVDLCDTLIILSFNLRLRREILN